ncbi:MAG: redoxin domain-containing protein [Proteobacteria bacterium]|nr:redoxin domain-containing protein [Pseudomonadota bacterium]
MFLLLACAGNPDAPQIALPLGGCDVDVAPSVETTAVVDLPGALLASGHGGMVQTESGEPLVHLTALDRFGEYAWGRGVGGIFRFGAAGGITAYSALPFESGMGAGLDSETVAAWAFGHAFVFALDGDQIVEIARAGRAEPSAMGGLGDVLVFGSADGVVERAMLVESEIQVDEFVDLGAAVTFLRVEPDAIYAGAGGALHVLDPDTLAVERSLALPAPARDVRPIGDDVVVSLGSQGVERLDAAGAVVWAADVGGTALGLDLTDDAVWVAAFEGVEQLDLDTGALLGRTRTDEFSYDVAAWDDQAIVAAFSDLHVVSRVATSEQPRGALELDVVAVSEDATRWPRLTNDGDAALTLVGGEGVVGEQVVLEPGAQIEVELTDEALAGGRACLATDDPALGRVDVTVRLASTDESLAALGAQAIDFELPAIDGSTYRLSDAEGPVIIAFFNSYCPVCPSSSSTCRRTSCVTTRRLSSGPSPARIRPKRPLPLRPLGA